LIYDRGAAAVTIDDDCWTAIDDDHRKIDLMIDDDCLKAIDDDRLAMAIDDDCWTALGDR
jgi:membrane protein implicated in regulation of membrane protease activity